MTYKAFLIKYAEIAIKGKNRYLFEDALVSQMNHALKKVDGTFHIRKEQGRIYVEMEGEYDYDGAVEALQHVFGIVGICPVVLLEDEGFDALAGEVIRYIDEVYPDKHFTFKVNARRARKNYPLESMEINAQMGERILEAFPETRVDVHKPQVMFNIEIRNQINVYSTVIPGPGGMPVGTYGGRREIMQCVAPLGEVYQAGTLSGNPIAMTAGIETLKLLDAHPEVYAKLEGKTAGLAQAAREAFGDRVCVNQIGSLMSIFFTDKQVVDMDTAMTSDTKQYAAFFRYMLDHGINLAPSQFEAMFISDAHTEEDIRKTIDVIKEFAHR